MVVCACLCGGKAVSPTVVICAMLTSRTLSASQSARVSSAHNHLSQILAAPCLDMLQVLCVFLVVKGPK